MSSRGGYVGVLLTLVVSGAILTWVGRQSWVSDGAPSGSFLPVNSLVTVVGAFALASTVAVIATRKIGRRITGSLITVGGLVAVVMSLAALSSEGIAPIWVATAVLSALVISLCGSSIVTCAGQWPGMSGRYERVVAPNAWAQLDAGEDPTLTRP